MFSFTAIPAIKRRGLRVASGSLLFALLSGYGAIVYLFDDDGQHTRQISSEFPGRALQLSETDVDAEWDSRLLAKNGESPPTLDEVPGEFIVKPWVGNAATDVWENTDQTKLSLSSAQASTVMGANFLPRMAIDDPNLSTRWASSKNSPADSSEWINVDMGGPMSVAQVYIKWWDAYAEEYDIFVARERPNCRSDGTACPDGWTKVVSVTGKADASPTTDSFEDDDHELQGVRYVRVEFKKRAPNMENFSIYYIRVYRRKMIVGETLTGVSCGATVPAATSSLLSKYGGTLIQTYENSEFFAAEMTEAQKDAMFEDDCVFTVEPNYIVRARGRTTAKRLGDNSGVGMEEHRRRLGIPEFNLRDENPANWGLERISSHGRRNGKYTWFHEGEDTHIYLFDTGVYPSHSEWETREGTSRMGDGLICTGNDDDYTLTDHGTHMASIAAGFTMGTAKSATIHPIQVLNSNGEGTTATLLCGMEKLIQDGKDFNAANAPVKIKSVVNLSLGVNGRSDALDKAVKDMTDVGYTVVIAAGDNDDNACFFSPYDPTAIIVGGLSDHLQGMNDKTATSNYGECIDVWAPGEDILGASNTGEYESVFKSGTSVAAAFAAGAAALFFEEINTEEYEIEEFSARVKEKIMNKAEINILAKIGHGSPNKMMQTTASRCLQNSHCDTGLTCLRDGTCVDLSKPLKSSMIG